MATVGSAMNASLNSKNRLAMNSGELPSKNWIQCCVAPIANTAMWIILIEDEDGQFEFLQYGNCITLNERDPVCSQGASKQYLCKVSR